MMKFCNPRELALTFASYALPGMRTRLEKYDQIEASHQDDLRAFHRHDATAAETRRKADRMIAAHQSKAHS
ncbi:MAG: hypothetical protein NTV32_05390 [Gammaproteobacteria bacterium]|nr:hypothetical protein [Gammaproteobacteria bacterium]